ncbi:zf-CCHC domain-containing protein [Cephalotus follicularis]|uniref:Zf-CCHC domain-containing protein n=1 Tax=Cephalotus follicularis TaxID=3775 RepID=A0A1Q3DCY5_CEPFO|nr:zf-CCHC domain-containing protein [Cephalotus follicularis]
MSVTQYEHKFLELSHYAPTLVADQEERCQRFLDGLSPEIRHSIATIEWNVFCNLVESAMRVELSVNKQRSRQDRGQKWPALNLEVEESSSKNQRTRVGKGTWGGSPQQRTQAPVPSFSHGTPEMESATFSSPSRCQQCGRHHVGECGVETHSCYHCGQTGHLRNKCPLRLQGATRTQGLSSSDVPSMARELAQRTNQLGAQGSRGAARQASGSGAGSSRPPRRPMATARVYNLKTGTGLTTPAEDEGKFVSSDHVPPVFKILGTKFLRWGGCNTPYLFLEDFILRPCLA